MHIGPVCNVKAPDLCVEKVRILKCSQHHCGQNRITPEHQADLIAMTAVGLPCSFLRVSTEKSRTLRRRHSNLHSLNVSVNSFPHPVCLTQHRKCSDRTCNPYMQHTSHRQRTHTRTPAHTPPHATTTQTPISPPQLTLVFVAYVFLSLSSYSSPYSLLRDCARPQTCVWSRLQS